MILKSYFAYNFVSGSRSADYVGRTKRQLLTWLKNVQKVTCIQTSEESQRRKALRNNDCFYVIDYATTQYSFSLKEGMHIGWQKPALNKHVDSLACSICVKISMVSNQTTVKVYFSKYDFFRQFLVIDYFTIISFYIFIIYFNLSIEFFVIL